MIADKGFRILYHVTTEPGYESIQRDMLIKPGPGGNIWLVQSCRLDWVIQHLWKQGKIVRIILGVDTNSALRWLPLKGVWVMREPTPSWFFVGRIGGNPPIIGGRRG